MTIDEKIASLEKACKTIDDFLSKIENRKKFEIQILSKHNEICFIFCNNDGNMERLYKPRIENIYEEMVKLYKNDSPRFYFIDGNRVL